jgi:hypothetical protein
MFSDLDRHIRWVVRNIMLVICDNVSVGFRMARQLVPSQQKLAEKLSLINDRGTGMLTRIYNIKKVIFLDSKFIHVYLWDEFHISSRGIDSVWRWIMKETHPPSLV